MKVNGKQYTAVWFEGGHVSMIDQRSLPFQFSIHTCENWKQTADAIRKMTVRGAGTIGATAGFAMAQAFLETDFTLNSVLQAKREIESTRPTARDLFYAVEKVFTLGSEGWKLNGAEAAGREAVKAAQAIADKYAENARSIGDVGKSLIRQGYQVLTHCNAGWLALVDYGSALSPVYQAFAEGKVLHVWVDETRPRCQGARLTAWELQQEGVPHTIISDNAVAFLMSKGKVDMVITGADRIAANGDTANKIGTLEKAILAREYKLPFYVAAPLSTLDINCPDGNAIVIEERSPDEVIYASGPDKQGDIREIQLCNPGSGAFNPAFDVTPASLITGYITEKGLFKEITSLLKTLETNEMLG